MIERVDKFTYAWMLDNNKVEPRNRNTLTTGKFRECISQNVELANKTHTIVRYRYVKPYIYSFFLYWIESWTLPI